MLIAKLARQRSRANAEPFCDVRRAGLSMWEELRQNSLDGRPERGALLRTVGERFFCVSQKQIVQVIVRPDNREGCYGRCKNYLVASCAKFNIASEKAPHFCGRFVTSMSNSQMARCQPGLRHLAADPHQRHQPELDLMPLRLPIDIDIVERYCDRSIV